MNHIRLLIFDLVFPRIYGRWRTVEINYFLSSPEFETDIFIPRYQVEVFRYFEEENIVTSFEYYYQRYPYLNDYNILIFNPQFNCLNRFNKIIDGTKYNRKYLGDFLLTKRFKVDFRSYHLGYTIFLATYLRRAAREIISKRYWPTICKIYPGEGFSCFDRNVGRRFTIIKNDHNVVIGTQRFVTEIASRYIDQVYSIYGGPLSEGKKETKRWENNNSDFHVCFTAMAFVPQKGSDVYLQLVEKFQKDYPNYKVHFHVIGIKSSPDFQVNIIFHGHLIPDDLNKLYHDTIDVYVSPNRNNNSNVDGFPLGGKAMLEGCIPIISDPNICNKDFGFTEEEALVMNPFEIEKAIELIVKLVNNFDLRKSMSVKIQRKAERIFGPENQLYPVVDIMKSLR